MRRVLLLLAFSNGACSAAPVASDKPIQTSGTTAAASGAVASGAEVEPVPPPPRVAVAASSAQTGADATRADSHANKDSMTLERALSWGATRYVVVGEGDQRRCRRLRIAPPTAKKTATLAFEIAAATDPDTVLGDAELSLHLKEDKVRISHPRLAKEDKWLRVGLCAAELTHGADAEGFFTLNGSRTYQSSDACEASRESAAPPYRVGHACHAIFEFMATDYVAAAKRRAKRFAGDKDEFAKKWLRKPRRLGVLTHGKTGFTCSAWSLQPKHNGALFFSRKGASMVSYDIGLAFRGGITRSGPNATGPAGSMGMGSFVTKPFRPFGGGVYLGSEMWFGTMTDCEAAAKAGGNLVTQ